MELNIGNRIGLMITCRKSKSCCRMKLLN